MTVDYVASLRSSSASVATSAAGRLDEPIPSCPGWTMADLVGHVGFVYARADAVVRARGPVDLDRVPTLPDGADLLPAYNAVAAALVEALAGLPVDEPIWNWFGIEPPIPGFYHRRMAQETAIHAWDAQTCAGVPDPIEATLAVDGIDEMLAGFLFYIAPPVDLGGSLHLHATDADSEWVIENVDGHLRARPGHEKCAAAVRGSASDLLLYLWNRVDPAALDVVGDAAIAARWRSAVSL